MRASVARRAILVLALMALLFTVDAAFSAELGTAAVVLILIVGAAFARWILHLAEHTLYGTADQRWVALVALNVSGALPAAAAFLMLRGLTPSQQAWAARATLAWIVAIVVWTTMVLLAAPSRHIPARPAARGVRGRVLTSARRPHTPHPAR